jgi:hypothetical protein
MLAAWSDYSGDRVAHECLLTNIQHWRDIDASGAPRALPCAGVHALYFPIVSCASQPCAVTGEQVTKEDIKMHLPANQRARSSRPSISCEEALECHGVNYVSYVSRSLLFPSRRALPVSFTQLLLLLIFIDSTHRESGSDSEGSAMSTQERREKIQKICMFACHEYASLLPASPLPC